MASNKFFRLLARGDMVSIESGRACIQPISGSVVPDRWLAANSDNLICEAAKQLGIPALKYESCDTGKYGSHRAGGLTLQFRDLVSDKAAYVIFNVDLDRARSTKNGAAGSPLPKGQFRPCKRSYFIKFWEKTGLKLPPRFSSFHDYMGNLKDLVFTGQFSKGSRLNAAELAPLNITYQQLLASFDVAKTPHLARTVYGQVPDNPHTRMTYKQTHQEQPLQGVQGIGATGSKSYDTSNQGSTDTRGNVIPIAIHKRPEDQTIQEWLADFTRGSKD